MITFKDFIYSEVFFTEEQINKSFLSEEWEDVESTSTQNISHYSKTVGNLKLKVYAERYKTKDGTHDHHLDFAINGDTTKKINSDLTTGSAVLAHVGHAIHHYIKHYVNKGDLLIMSAGDLDERMKEKKNVMYGAYAKKLAKSTGGEYYKHELKSNITHQIHY